MLFAGDTPDDQLPEYYASCDLAVLPSKDMSEGFGLTILEANAVTKPVIATNAGGLPAIVRDGYNGLLVQPNNEVEMTNSILELSRDAKAPDGRQR